MEQRFWKNERQPPSRSASPFYQRGHTPSLSIGLVHSNGRSPTPSRSNKFSNPRSQTPSGPVGLSNERSPPRRTSPEIPVVNNLDQKKGVCSRIFDVFSRILHLVMYAFVFYSLLGPASHFLNDLKTLEFAQCFGAKNSCVENQSVECSSIEYSRVENPPSENASSEKPTIENPHIKNPLIKKSSMDNSLLEKSTTPGDQMESPPNAEEPSNLWFNWLSPTTTFIPISLLTKQLSLTFGEDILYTFPSKQELREFTLASNEWPMKISNGAADAILLAGMGDLAQLDSKFEDAISIMETRLESFYRQINIKVVSEWEKEVTEKANLPIRGGMLKGLEISTKVKDQMLPYVHNMGDTLVEMKSFLFLLNETLARPKTYCNLGEKKNQKVGDNIQQVLICPEELTMFLNFYYTLFSNYLINMEEQLPQVKAFERRLIDNSIQIKTSLIGDSYAYPYEGLQSLEIETIIMDQSLSILENAETVFSKRRK